MKLPTLVSRSFLPRVNQSESPLKSARTTVRVTRSIPQRPKPPRKARIKAEKATAFPKMMMEK